ncbi:MAG: zf-HC2 domain-containing protein [Krumholzibacteria bacterium]|nr:zf-HC2 domain-containing protein [Candidatus Krumholzibacteria bacterium]
MSGCVEYIDRLALLVLGELPSADADKVAVHLTACAGCRRERDILAATLALLTAPLETPLDEPEQLRISNAYYRRVAARRPGRVWDAPWLRIAAACGLVVVGIGLGTRLAPSPEPAVPVPDLAVAPAVLTSDEFASRRLTPEGFRVIARGRQAAGGH